MSAPHPEPATSISSSGQTDGLGRRELYFDRETGAMFERLHLRPELAVYEPAIRDRMGRLAGFDHPGFCHDCTLERDRSAGHLTVVSPFVPGSRLSDAIERASDDGVVPGLLTGLGYLLEALGALAALEAGPGFAHGLIAPARTVLTPEGGVVFLDAEYGEVIERLGMSRRRLWTELGVATPPGSGHPQLDYTVDIGQAALTAAMLATARNLDSGDVGDRLPSLLMEIVEDARSLSTEAFATTLQRALQRMLPLPGRRPYRSVREALDDVRQVLRRDIGADACTLALRDFVQGPAPVDVPAADAMFDEEMPLTPDEDTSLPTGGDAHPFAEPSAADEAIEFEVDLDAADPPSRRRRAEDSDEVYELTGLDLNGTFEVVPAPPPSLDQLSALLRATTSRESARAAGADAPRPEVDAAPAVDSAPAVHSATPADGATAVHSAARVDDRAPADAAMRVDADGRGQAIASAESGAAADASPSDAGAAQSSSGAGARPIDEADSRAATSGHSRRKRQQQKSARARKDKLRSATAAVGKAPEPAAPKVEAPRPELLASPFQGSIGAAPAPAYAAQLGPSHVPALPTLAPASPPAGLPATHPIVSYPGGPAPAPAVPAMPAGPVFPSLGAPRAPMPRFGPLPGAQAAPSPALEPVTRLEPLKIKTEPPAGYVPAARPRKRIGQNADPLPALFKDADVPPRRFPFKLAIAVLVLVGAAIVAGRAYLPGGPLARPLPEPMLSGAAEPESEPPVSPQPRNTGQIAVTTEPAGARVLLDGKAAGESPLTLDGIPTGRHVLTFISSSGSVKRTVKVVGGKTIQVDLPVFSGWVSVFAPIVLDVSEDGKLLGTTEQGRLMLAPGTHRLSFSNHDLGFRIEREVQVTAGDVTSLRLDAAGKANFNAVPWAEVWSDGRKIGDTPLANHSLPLGSHEFVFRHPQLGERRVTATIHAGQTTAVAVDFTKPF